MWARCSRHSWAPDLPGPTPPTRNRPGPRRLEGIGGHRRDAKDTPPSLHTSPHRATPPPSPAPPSAVAGTASADLKNPFSKLGAASAKLGNASADLGGGSARRGGGAARRGGGVYFIHNLLIQSRKRKSVAKRLVRGRWGNPPNCPAEGTRKGFLPAIRGAATSDRVV